MYIAHDHSLYFFYYVNSSDTMTERLLMVEEMSNLVSEQ